MSDPAQVLREFKPSKEFFIGIDSDGCIFDSMEIKHKECFAPMFIKHFHLQAVSKYAREVWEFVNLYSKDRGANRFPALAKAVKLLGARPPVQARKVKMPETAALDEWIKRETKLGNATLNAEVARGNQGLAQVKVWSDAVNKSIEDIVHGVPPFPLVRESLDKIHPQADAMCISQTPGEALKREWAEHDIAQFVKIIAGQEMGTKTDHLKLAAKDRRAQAEVRLERIRALSEEAGAAYDALSSRLASLKTFLENDLTPAGVKGAEPSMAKARQEASALVAILDKAVAELTALRGAIGPGTAPTPATTK